MKITFLNQQDETDSMNGTTIADRAELTQLLNSRQEYMPFIVQFSGDNAFELIVGLGGAFGCVQYSGINGKSPYLMAMSPNPPLRAGYLEFLCGGTPTAFAARYIISFAEVTKIVLDFLETGERSRSVSWQELDPLAVEKDMKILTGQH